MAAATGPALLAALLVTLLPHAANAYASLPGDKASSAEDDRMRNHFRKWRAKFHIEYDGDTERKEKAFQIFKRHELKLERHNDLFAQGKVSWKMQQTQYADRDNEDDLVRKTGFRRLELTGAAEPLRKLTRQPLSGRRLGGDADDFDGKDWEDFLPETVDQESCASCWAFTASYSVVGAFHMWQWMTESGSYPMNWLSNRDHSQQQMMDCDAGWPKSDGGTSCSSGGSVSHALSWIADNGVARASDQPYKAKDKTCDMSGMKTKLSCDRDGKTADGCSKKSDNPYYCPKASSYTNGEYTEELKQMLLLAPVGITIYSCALPSTYSSGVLPYSQCGSVVDHAVTLIGWGWDSGVGKTYWKMRNSWGKWWGENGNFRIERTGDVAGIKDENPCIPLGAQYY